MTSDFSSGLSSEVPLMLALALVLPRPRWHPGRLGQPGLHPALGKRRDEHRPAAAAEYREQDSVRLHGGIRRSRGRVDSYHK